MIQLAGLYFNTGLHEVLFKYSIIISNHI